MNRLGRLGFRSYLIVVGIAMVIPLAWVWVRAMPEDGQICWNCPKMRDLEKQWRPLEKAYLAPEKIVGAAGRDKAIQFQRMGDRLLRRTLSDRELGQLARSPDGIPEHRIGLVVTDFMVRTFLDKGDRDSLVELLSRRCPGRVGGWENIELCLAQFIKRYDDDYKRSERE